MEKSLLISKKYDIFKNIAPILKDVRILLIYPPVRLSQKPLYPPYGLLSLASVLERAGATIDLIDLNLLRLPFKKLHELIKNKKFDVMATGGMTTVYYYMKFLAEYFKREYPHIPLIAGGTACSGSPEIVMNSTRFDVCVVGEGESVIVDIIHCLLNGKDLSTIPGIYYRDDENNIVKTDWRPRIENLDDLPFPAYHLANMEQYIANAEAYKNKGNKVADDRIRRYNLDPVMAARPVMLFTKRGCPFGCNFCYRNFGRKVIGLSVERTLAHMEFLEKNYNTINFVFGDETFNVNRKWVIEFCNTLIKSDKKYILNVANGLRANVIDKELVNFMKEAGFCSVAVGIESFYEPTLRDMKKGQTPAQIEKAIRIIRESGFHIASAQFLFGYPSDSKESILTNIKMCQKLGLKSAGFSIPCPYPGTFLFDQAIAKGLLENNEKWLMELADKDISDRIINMSSMPDSELVSLATWGRDEVRLRFIRKSHPLFGYLLTILQKTGRKFGISVLDILKAVKDGIKIIILKRKWPGSWSRSGGASDEFIKEETLTLLKNWNSDFHLD